MFSLKFRRIASYIQILQFLLHLKIKGDHFDNSKNQRIDNFRNNQPMHNTHIQVFFYKWCQIWYFFFCKLHWCSECHTSLSCYLIDPLKLSFLYKFKWCSQFNFKYLNIRLFCPNISFEESWFTIGAPNVMYHYLDIQFPI